MSKQIIWDDSMDKECISLCEAINSIEGLQTVESCCGHNKQPFSVIFDVETLEHLPVLLYFIDPCHVGFRWDCSVYTDCVMRPVRFELVSRSVGEQAYSEAEAISKHILAHLEAATTPKETVTA